MFVDDCDESTIVSDAGDAKSSESNEETCCSIWLSLGGANTSEISFCCEDTQCHVVVFS